MILLGILEDIAERKQRLTMYDIMYITIELTKIKTQINKINKIGGCSDNEYITKLEKLYTIIINDYFNALGLECKKFNFMHDSKVYKLYIDIYLQGSRCLYKFKNDELKNHKRDFLCDLANIGFEIEKLNNFCENIEFSNIDITDKQFSNLLSGYNEYVLNYMSHSVEFQYVVDIFKEIKYLYLKRQLQFREEYKK